MPFIISTPKQDNSDSTELLQEHRFGYFETIGPRREQEDALAWHSLQPEELAPADGTAPLTPIEIGHRLWTTYQRLDAPELAAGTTAATTIYDGQGHFITAILADAAAFVAVYDKQGHVLGVVRLNSVTHKPGDSFEMERIKNVGGNVVLVDRRTGLYRVNGSLAVSRAIGDNKDGLKEAGVCSEATIDITDMDQICTALNISPEHVGTFQIISTCDGFTDGAGCNQSKDSHQTYLFDALKALDSPGSMPEDKLATALAKKALGDGAWDNVSVAVQTITGAPVFVGVYDGHGGKEASCYVAENIGTVFKAQCALNREAYLRQALSVHHKAKAYQRDNHDAAVVLPHPVALHSQLFHTPVDDNKQHIDEIFDELLMLTEEYRDHLNSKFSQEDTIAQIAQELVNVLGGNQSKEDKIKGYYQYLDADSPVAGMKNMDFIQQDTSISAGNLLKFLAIIVATIVTFILPGLLVMGVVYATTGRQPLDLLYENGERFGKETDRVKARISFFRAEPSDSPVEANTPSVAQL